MAKAKRISNQERKATQVAFSVAEEILNNKMAGHKFLAPNFGIRPEMLNRPLIKNEMVEFYFVGGVKLEVYLFDMGTLLESWREKRQDWVVYQVTVRFPLNGEKKTDVYYAPKLTMLKEHRPWHHPRPLSSSKICGNIGIFWDNASGTGHVEADPDYNQDGFSVLTDEVSYQVLVPGDKEKAIAKAKDILSGYYEE